jgi:hypothetical protein
MRHRACARAPAFGRATTSQPSSASKAWNRASRETRLYSIAPVSNNLVLAYLGQHVLGMPRSY